MAGALPILLLLAAGLFLSLMLLALWNSLRGLIAHGGDAPAARAPTHGARSALLHEKEELLNAIRELRFEHELGKVSDADFQRLDQRYRTRARDVLRALDQQITPFRAQARAQLDAAVGATSVAPATVASAPVAVAEPPGCRQCGTSNDADALFCKKCGQPLREGATR